jgi:hypothetical protein
VSVASSAEIELKPNAKLSRQLISKLLVPWLFENAHFAKSLPKIL